MKARSSLFVLVLLSMSIFAFVPNALGQEDPLTYPKLLTALTAKLPRGVSREKIIQKLIDDVGRFGVDKPLTSDREEDLRQAGATDELIDAIRIMSPALPTKVPTPTPAPLRAPTPTPAQTEPPELVEARTAINRYKDYAGATTILKNATDETKRNPLWAFYMATAYESIPDLQNAIYYWQQYDLAAPDKLTKEKISRLQGELDRKSGAAGKGAEYSRLGDAAVDSKDWKTAISEYSKAIEQGGEGKARPYNQRCLAYLNLQEYDRAIADCSRAIQIDADYYQPYGSRGQAYFGKGSYDAAIDDLSNWIRLKPDDKSAYRWRGVAYSVKKEFGKAINDLTIVISLDRGNAEAYDSRGAVYFANKDYDMAVQDFSAAIRLNPGTKVYYLHRSGAYYLAGKKDLAKADEQKAQSLPN